MSVTDAGSGLCTLKRRRKGQLMHNIGIGEPEFQCATGIWYLQPSSGKYAGFAAVSFTSASRLLCVESNTLKDVSEAYNVITDQPTVHFGVVLDWALCQICACDVYVSGLKVSLDTDRTCAHIRFSSPITLAATSQSFAVICLPCERNIILLTFHASDDGNYIETSMRIPIDHEPSCVTLSEQADGAAIVAYGDHSGGLNVVHCNPFEGRHESICSASIGHHLKTLDDPVVPEGVAIDLHNSQGHMEIYVTSRTGSIILLNLENRHLRCIAEHQLDRSPLSIKKCQDSLLLLGSGKCWYCLPTGNESQKRSLHCVQLLGCTGCTVADSMGSLCDSHVAVIAVCDARLMLFINERQRSSLSSENIVESQRSTARLVKCMHSFHGIACVWEHMSGQSTLALRDRASFGKLAEIELPRNFQSCCISEINVGYSKYLVVGGQDAEKGLLCFIEWNPSSDSLRIHAAVTVSECIVKIESCQSVPNGSFAGNNLLFASISGLYGCTVTNDASETSALKLGSSRTKVTWLYPCPCDILTTCEEDDGIVFRSLRAQSFVPRYTSADRRGGAMDEDEVFQYSLEHVMVDKCRRPEPVACLSEQNNLVLVGDATGRVACLKADTWTEVGTSESSEGMELEIAHINFDTAVRAIVPVCDGVFILLANATVLEVSEIDTKTFDEYWNAEGLWRRGYNIVDGVQAYLACT